MHDRDNPVNAETPLTTPTPEHASRPLVPDWLVQSASLGWRLLAVIALGVVALAAAAILGSVVAAVVLAAVVTAAFEPLTERLAPAGDPRAPRPRS